MSGFGRGAGRSGHGRGSASGGIAALRRGMAPKKKPPPPSQAQAIATSSAGAGRGAAKIDSSSQEESFQLHAAPQGSSQYASMIRLTPGLLDDLRRAEAEGMQASIKFGSLPSGHQIKVGHQEYKFSSAVEQGELCDVFEEQTPGEDGQGVLSAVGSVWRKISVQRTLCASEKDRVKKRTTEAEKQIKSRKTIVVDSSLMKADPAPGADGNARRPPIKPPPKRRKVTPTVAPAKSKPAPPQSASVPSKEKNGPVLTAESVVPAARSPPIAATSSAPPLHSQPVLPANVDKRVLVEEIALGSSPQTSKATQKEKEKPEKPEKPEKTEKTEKISMATTPEVHVKASAGAVNMTELRNTIIALLMETPRNIKAIEKSLGEVMPQPDRKSIERILKSIALYKAPGRYELKPGVQMESYAKPSPGSSSLPEAAAADSPDSPAGAAESAANQNKVMNTGIELERIDIGEQEESPSKSTPVEQKVSVGQEEDEEGEVQPTGTPEENANVEQVPSEEPNPPKAAGSSGSSSSSDSGSDSDSDSGSSSGSGSSGSSGSDSSSSSSDDEENVDIVSDEEHHKQKAKAEKKSLKGKPARLGSERQTSDEVHNSEDIDVGDADDAKLNSVVEGITETIPLEVDIISCEGGANASGEAPEAFDAKSPAKDTPEFPESAAAQSSPQRSRENGLRERREVNNGPRERRDIEDGHRERREIDDGLRERREIDDGLRERRIQDRREGRSLETPVLKVTEHNARERGSSGTRAPAESKAESKRVEAPPENGFEQPPANSDSRHRVSAAGLEPQPQRHSGYTAQHKHYLPDAQLQHRTTGAPKVDGRTKISARKPKESEPRKEAERKASDATGTRIPMEIEKRQTDSGLLSLPVAPVHQSKDTEFFAPYEKAFNEPKGPIKSHEQYMEYCHEYREKYPIYVRLNDYLESDRENFENLQRDIDVAKSVNDKTRLAGIYQKVTQDYSRCRKRFKRMSKTFLLLHEELRMLKDRCKEYADQASSNYM